MTRQPEHFRTQEKIISRGNSRPSRWFMHVLYIRIPSSDWKITAATVNEGADEAYRPCSRSQDGNVPRTAFVLRLQWGFFGGHGLPTVVHWLWRTRRCSGHSAQKKRLALEMTFYENPILKFMIRIMQMKLPYTSHEGTRRKWWYSSTHFYFRH